MVSLLLPRRDCSNFSIYFFLNLSIGGIKKHLILKQKNYYYLPVLRGISFIPLPLIVFFSLQHISIKSFYYAANDIPFLSTDFCKVYFKRKTELYKLDCNHNRILRCYNSIKT